MLSAQELDGEHAARMAAIRFAGEVLIGSEVHKEDTQPYHSLYDAARDAYQGKPEALEMIKTNVTTDVIERTIKAGFVSDKVRLETDGNGTLIQHGQSSRSIQANSLRRNQNHPVMLKRTEAETRNNFRIEQMNREGLFKEYNLVVFSLAENLPDCGFFTETMSCSIQVTSEDEQGLTLESAFVAGKDNHGHVFAKETVERIYKEWARVDISNMDNAQILDLPLLVPKSLMNGGVVDMVKLYDFFAGSDKFFGLDQPKQDYDLFRQQCSQRQAEYGLTVDQITADFLFQVPMLKNKQAASELLDILSEKYTVVRAVTDENIDPMVFGATAANYIYDARISLNRGDWDGANSSIRSAQATAKSSSCAVAGGADSSRNQSEAAGSDGEDKYGSLSFYCPNGHKNTRERNQLLDRCKYCKISVKC